MLALQEVKVLDLELWCGYEVHIPGLADSAVGAAPASAVRQIKPGVLPLFKPAATVVAVAAVDKEAL